MNDISSNIFDEIMNILGNGDIDKDNFYFLNSHDTLVHMCKVASGIDSQVLGEQEILGQFKKALKIAQEIKIVRGKLLTLSNMVLEISKKARTKTDIGLNSLSVSGLAYKLVKNIFEEPKNQNILIVGAGSLAHSVMENLFKNGINKIKSVNRSVKKIKLANNYEVVSSSLDSTTLGVADIVIASSATELPLIGKEQLKMH